MRTAKLSLLLCAGLFFANTHAADPVAPGKSLEARVQALIKKVKRTMRPLKGGTFDMGDWGGKTGLPYDMDMHSKPLHKVTLDGFSMMAYKVTYEDFDVFTDATGKERVDMGEIEIKERLPKRPAGVSWHGAKDYCRWLGRLTGLPFDLPTEAQWEYAARSGGKRLLYATDNGKIDRARNFPKKWDGEGPVSTIPDVGSFPPNPAGLFGMTENTHEWVNDWYGHDYYKISPKINPQGPMAGTEKVKRGADVGSSDSTALVFMRTKDVPQTLHSSFPNGIQNEEVLVPLPGYSSHKSNNFRCVSNI